MMQETDRELLELAAKAAGYIIVQWCGPLNAQYPTCISADGSSRVWNPLIDDGDALRLAVKLQLTVQVGSLDGTVVVTSNNNSAVYEAETWNLTGEQCAATRRAIVRAAAEIGKAM